MANNTTSFIPSVARTWSSDQQIEINLWQDGHLLIEQDLDESTGEYKRFVELDKTMVQALLDLLQRPEAQVVIEDAPVHTADSLAKAMNEINWKAECEKKPGTADF
jgi:hypothetical protein